MPGVWHEGIIGLEVCGASGLYENVAERVYGCCHRPDGLPACVLRVRVRRIRRLGSDGSPRVRLPIVRRRLPKSNARWPPREVQLRNLRSDRGRCDCPGYLRSLPERCRFRQAGASLSPDGGFSNAIAGSVRWRRAAWSFHRVAVRADHLARAASALNCPGRRSLSFSATSVAAEANRLRGPLHVLRRNSNHRPVGFCRSS